MAAAQELDSQRTQRLALLSSCGTRLDCKSWCNIGNCYQCPCAACERCGPTDTQTLSASALPSASALQEVAPSTSSSELRGEPRAQPTAVVASTGERVSGRPSPADKGDGTANGRKEDQPAACHGWCIAGGEEDADVVCQSSKCNSCPVCKGRKAG